MDRPTRRLVLGLLAGLPLLVSAPAFGRKRPKARRPPAKPSLIGPLIGQAQALPRVAERIDFISRALIGVRYRANTLIGGPRRKEVLVVRDDAFDCVTFCEVALAAALARDLEAFEAALRHIRYRHGQVTWEERNHYFADWNARAIDNGICQPVAIEPAERIEKTVRWRHLGRRQVALTAIPHAALMASQSLLAAGDIIGFVSRRPSLDFFHTGLIAFGKDGALMLRHAARSRGRVREEHMDRFLIANRVQYVTVVRAVESGEG